MKLARGHVQQAVLDDLLDWGKTLEFSRYMKAQTYFTNYIDSFMSLFHRMEQAGYEIEIVRGPKHGYWNAHARLKK